MAAQTCISTDINELFPLTKGELGIVDTLQRKAWSGKMSSPPLRALCWRVLLGILCPTRSLQMWSFDLRNQVRDYSELKENIFPQIDKVSADPLSSFSHGEDKESPEWRKFYKDVELCNFIKGDLDRLYMNGIDDEYFQTKERRDNLLAVLFVWSARNPHISYRQGMHEIVGPVLFCLERESEAWQANDVDSSHPLFGSFKKDTVEAHTFWMFERIMFELSMLYDPTSETQGGEAHPPIVNFCTKVQEHFLRDLDPELCGHLEDNFIQAQLYGMRWCRLLFGREIPMTHTHCLRVWDYIFASCAVTKANYYKYAPSCLPPVPGVAVAVKEDPMGETQRSPEVLATIARKGKYSPMIAAVADFMLGMLLHIRSEMVEGDSNTIMMLLMHYPDVEDVTPILDLTDMIRRGVLRMGAHMGASSSTELFGESADVSSKLPPPAKTPPAWLLNTLKPSSIAGNMSSMTQKVVDRFSARPASQSSSKTSLDSRSVQFQTSADLNDSQEDPLSALLGPANSFLAEATSSTSAMFNSFLSLDEEPPKTPSRSSTRQGSDDADTSKRPVALLTPAPMTVPKGLASNDPRLRRPENWSGGVDLPQLSKSYPDILDEDSLSTVADYSVHCRKISSRLACLAEVLSDASAAPSEGSQLQSIMGEVARRLTALSDVLDGQCSLSSYDKSLEATAAAPSTSTQHEPEASSAVGEVARSLFHESDKPTGIILQPETIVVESQPPVVDSIPPTSVSIQLPPAISTKANESTRSSLLDSLLGATTVSTSAKGFSLASFDERDRSKEDISKIFL